MDGTSFAPPILKRAELCLHGLVWVLLEPALQPLDLLLVAFDLQPYLSAPRLLPLSDQVLQLRVQLGLVGEPQARGDQPHLRRDLPVLEIG